VTADQLALEIGGFPTALRPMQAVTAEAPFADPSYVFEVKWEGLRSLLFVTAEGDVRLQDRSLDDLTYRFPEFDYLHSELPPGTVLDGTLVVTDGEGRPDRDGLRRRLEGPAGEHQRPAAFLAFDILWLEGRSLLRQPLRTRKRHLERSVRASRHLYAPRHIEKEGVELFEVCLEQGLPGVMAKHRESLYIPGQRSPFWLQVQAVKADSFVVLGWLGEQPFDALLVGYYEGDRIHPCGTVGGGWEGTARAAIKEAIDELATPANPLGEVVMEAPVHWLRPGLVISVRYSEWSPDGTLRFPIFDRIRRDIHPSECVRHRPRVVIAGRTPRRPEVVYLTQFPF
jgi:bifunctional non-homologous end joining protein LigD